MSKLKKKVFIFLNKNVESTRPQLYDKFSRETTETLRLYYYEWKRSQISKNKAEKTLLDLLRFIYNRFVSCLEGTNTKPFSTREIKKIKRIEKLLGIKFE